LIQVGLVEGVGCANQTIVDTVADGGLVAADEQNGISGGV
jgi:hypothetical protein